MAVESMRRQTDLAQLERTRQLRERVAEACRFVGSGQGVRGVHIVTGARPTYEELRLYQDCAAACGVHLTVDGHGMIAVRPMESERAMNLSEIVAGLIGIALLVYLTYALLFPERF